MDFHGNIEIMLFSDKLEQLKEMYLEEPVAFKVKITHTEMFTRMNVTKIMTLRDAKKECKKVKKEVREMPQEPLNIAIRLESDMSVLDELYTLIRQNPGSRPLKIIITAKLQNVVIDSAIHVNNSIVAALEDNKFVDILG